MLTLPPRLVIAGTHSGVGKTTVATGLMAAFSTRGLRVAAAKVGPDFIDPGYHALATGRASHSLDCHLHGRELLPGLAAAAAADADLLVVEDVMGLFDGSAIPGQDGSTAEVARLIEAPVVLVVDASAMSGSVAALVHGFASFDPRLELSAVVLNRVGGDGHVELLREALAPTGIPVVGALGLREELAWRERHLGLVPVAEHPLDVGAAIGGLAVLLAERLDLEALWRLARAAPRRSEPEPPRARHVGQARVALCGGPAFSFVYPENLRLLEQAGAELVPFDPLVDAHLPEGCSGLVAGGGFPEAFAERLAANSGLLAELRAAVARGMVTWAECGGLLLLCDSLDGVPMAGALSGVRAEMTDRLTIGYRSATTRRSSPLGASGTQLAGHEFHRSVTHPGGDALDIEGRFGRGSSGFCSDTLFASYLHQHLAASPELAEAFVRRCAEAAAAAASAETAGSTGDGSARRL